MPVPPRGPRVRETGHSYPPLGARVEDACGTLRVMAQAVHHVFTFAEYVQLEADSTVRHEFFGGRIWAMAAGSPGHAAITARVVQVLADQLRNGRHEVFTSDLRIRAQATGLATYPDCSVVYRPLELDPEDPRGHTVVNPRVVVEVLSSATQVYDRGEKRQHYQTIPSLREVVLVDHDARRIEVWRHVDEPHWVLHAFAAGKATLASIDCELPLDEIFRDPLANG
jgi:Uma2 family endonuclease